MTAHDEITYALPSLLKLAYHACNQTQRGTYDVLDFPDVDLQICCQLLFQIIKLNTESGAFDSLGDRRFMFDKVQPIFDDWSIEIICEKAASYGHIDCLKLAREIGVPWAPPYYSDRSMYTFSHEY